MKPNGVLLVYSNACKESVIMLKIKCIIKHILPNIKDVYQSDKLEYSGDL